MVRPVQNPDLSSEVQCSLPPPLFSFFVSIYLLILPLIFIFFQVSFVYFIL
jgi:hypothetical protein